MVNGKYSKHFPKEYRERTYWAENNYLLHARPNNSLVFEHNEARFTNQYIVPYCSQLLFLFDCYFNVEISAGLGTVKYLSKYIYKGLDKMLVWGKALFSFPFSQHSILCLSSTSLNVKLRLST